MKNHFQQDYHPATFAFAVPSISLHSIVSRLQVGLMAETVDKKSLIINDVDKDLLLSADEDILAYVVGGMISNAVYSTSNSCIRVETIRDENGIRLCVRNNGAFTHHSNMVSLENMLQAARRIGGGIGLQSEAGGRLTVMFIFPSTAA